MTKKEFHRYVGSMQQVAYIRPIEYQEGRSSQLKAFEIKSGDLHFHVISDKCLDISDFSYKGMNMTFLAKTGLQGRNSYDTNGEESLRSIMGGLFFTCGLENICAPCTIDGKDYPMHGRLRTTPAEHVSSDAFFDGDDYRITVSGEVREAELFGENMVLRRKIETSLLEKSICVYDEIENQSFVKAPLMLLYHCNFGYPFLNEDCRLYLPTVKVEGREEWSQRHLDQWMCMEKPLEEETEYVFIHELRSNEKQDTMALLVNEKLKLGLKLEFNQKFLPYFMEWKSLNAGDYVLGLEPSNSSVYGRTYHMETDSLHYLEPFQKEFNRLKFTVLDDEVEIERVKEKIRWLRER